MSRLDLALEQIVTVRKYTTQMLDCVREEDWFRLPPAGVSHVAWQVGHLAFAQIRLALLRIRGPKTDDAQLYPPEFDSLFGRLSVPEANASTYPGVSEIRAVFDRVHQRVLEEIPRLPEAELDEAVEPPHRVARNKLWSLLWCAQHEMLHAGQIGLIRRQLGYTPMW
jgi:hypothetical protein